MRLDRVRVPIVALLLTACWTASAWAQSGPVDVRILNGSINVQGTEGAVDFEVENGTAIAARVVGLIIEYDTASGSTVTLESQAGLDVRIEPGETTAHTANFDTVYSQGEFFDWRHPYTIDAAIGADIASIDALVEQAGENPDRLLDILGDVTRLTPILRRSGNRFGDQIEALPDSAAWFDYEAVGAYQPVLEEAVCVHYGRRVRRARGAENRAETYHEIAETLTLANLYPDCIEREDRLAAARALVATGKAQDALVLTERDENGDVLEEWQEIYISGRVALAELAVQGAVMRQFRPGLLSLNELATIDPDNPDLQRVADLLLPVVAAHVDELIAGLQELEALEIVQMIREHFADHAAVQYASAASLASLVTLTERSLADDRHIRANNAYVRGLATFSEEEAWPATADQIQQLRSQYFVGIARNSIAEATDYSLGEAEEAIDEAESLFPIEPGVRSQLINDILLARWANIEAAVDEARYEDAMAKARELEASAENPEVLGDARAETYMRIAEEIWDRYGMLSGIASRNRLTLAEEALELGRSANPDRAASLDTSFLIARWLFPALILIVILVVGAVILFRGSWRKRRKARRLWQRGLRLADNDDFKDAAKLMDQAFDLVSLNDDAAVILDEENRGYMLLRLADVQLKRGRKDKVEPLRGEWKLLDDWEKPHSKDFDEAFEEFTEK